VNPSEIERNNLKVFYLIKLKDGVLRWVLTEENWPRRAELVLRVVCATMGEAIEEAKRRGKIS
jgi:hypothetical protein